MDVDRDLDLVGTRRAVDHCISAGGFSGVVRIDVDGETVLSSASGFADRTHRIANSAATRFAIASGAKTFTALVVLALVERGVLSLSDPARRFLGDDLPLVDDGVTIEQLLCHRSGIGDYLDENALESETDYVLSIPVHLLDSAESYLQVLDGHPQVSAPGEVFVYNNGGYVLLSIIAERATGVSFEALIDEYVVRPAGLLHTGLNRSDEAEAGVAVGYLFQDGLRSNVLHMPRLGSGDGGVCSTVDDVHRLWRAVDAGVVVSLEHVAAMRSPHGTTSSGMHHYGYGAWLSADCARIEMEGQDAGISFRSTHDPDRRLTWTVVSNWTYGAWPMCDAIAAAVGGATAT